MTKASLRDTSSLKKNRIRNSPTKLPSKTLKRLLLLTWAATINAMTLLYKFKMKKIENILTVISLAVVLGCSYYSFSTLNQLTSYLNEIERVARMGDGSTFRIVKNED